MNDKFVNALCKFGDFVENNVSSLINYFETKIYNFTNRKQLARKAAIKAKAKELSDKFGLHIENEYSLYFTNKPYELAFFYLQCDSLKNGGLDYYIACPDDFVVTKNSYTNYKYGVVNVDRIKFFDIDERIDNHIQKLIGRYKECLNEARKKQIEFDFSENKEPLFKEICEHYNLQKEGFLDNNLCYRSYLVPSLDLYYSPETNKILINPMFIEQEPDMTCGVFAVELNYNTFEEYIDFIDSKIEEYKNNFNNNINQLLYKKGKNKNDNK